jgi:hypothetical protein
LRLGGHPPLRNVSALRAAHVVRCGDADSVRRHHGATQCHMGSATSQPHPMAGFRASGLRRCKGARIRIAIRTVVLFLNCTAPHRLRPHRATNGNHHPGQRNVAALAKGGWWARRPDYSARLTQRWLRHALRGENRRLGVGVGRVCRHGTAPRAVTSTRVRQSSYAANLSSLSTGEFRWREPAEKRSPIGRSAPPIHHSVTYAHSTLVRPHGDAPHVSSDLHLILGPGKRCSSVAMRKSSMAGTSVAPRAAVARPAARAAFVCKAAAATSGFLLDMSDLISSGSQVRLSLPTPPPSTGIDVVLVMELSWSLD